MENTSLDDFLGDSDDTESSGGEESTGGDTKDSDSEDSKPDSKNGGAATSGGHDAGESNSGSPTSRWRPDGTECSNCTETATRLWQQGGCLVCGSCKSWE